MSDVSTFSPAAPHASRLLSPHEEARVFRRLRGRLVANLLRQALREARLRLFAVLALSAVLWLALFELFSRGFQFLIATVQHPDTQAQTVGAIYRVFFVSLMVMLVFSTAIILYGGLFRSRETRLLLTTPARTERIFTYKLQEAVLLSSWGFVLLGSPLLIAYGIIALAPWYYYLLLIPYTLAFVFIPGALGAILCLLFVYFFPRQRWHLLAAVGVGTIAALLWWGWSLAGGARGSMLTPAWFHDVFARLRFSEHKLLPSWWLSTGLLQTARGRWSEGVLFLALTVSNALVLHQLAAWLAHARLRTIYSNSAGASAGRKRTRPALIDVAVYRLTCCLPPVVRLLLVKDLRLFRRDPLQWSQFLIFFGLLGLYFMNTRWLRDDSGQRVWIAMISFLNVGVIGLILSTFTTRFIFPVISLEGRRFWILGLLPVDRDTILRTKFLFAFFGLLAPCCVLVFLSDLMLHVPFSLMLTHLVLCVVLCSGLSGIAVGLGARMPNLREELPAKIAAGFGGTLNLVVSTFYIVVVVVMVAVPAHFWISDGAPANRQLAPTWNQYRWLIAGVGGSVICGLLTTWIPLRMGLRAFRKLEL